MKNRIKELREARGLTQKELGKQVNVSRQAINAIETEKQTISVFALKNCLILKGVHENENNKKPQN